MSKHRIPRKLKKKYYKRIKAVDDTLRGYMSAIANGKKVRMKEFEKLNWKVVSPKSTFVSATDPFDNGNISDSQGAFLTKIDNK